MASSRPSRQFYDRGDDGSGNDVERLGQRLSRGALVLSIGTMLGLTSFAGPGIAQDQARDGAAAQSAARPAVPVSVVLAQRVDVAHQETYSGRIESINTVDLIARVQGYLRSKNFEEGAQVKQGEMLFELETDVYSNALDQAQAALQSAEAQRTLAQQTFDRQEALSQRDFASRQARDEARANLDGGIAAVAQAKAQVDAAQINLNYTRIVSPMNGRIGRSNVSVGDLIGPSSGTMVTIVETDPVYVTFPVPQARLLDIEKSGAKSQGATIRMLLADGSVYQHDGTFKYADTQATASTDSVLIRATMPNPEGLLLDRQLVSVQITSNAENLQLVIPQQALLTDQQGTYVLVVNDQDEVERANIQTSTQRDGMLVVVSGLAEGVRVITDGLQKVQPGSKVKASQAAGTTGSNANAAKGAAAGDAAEDAAPAADDQAQK